MLTGRRSATAVADDARERAADTVSDLAEKAAEIAREAQRAATPVIRGAMTSAAERARDAQHAASPVMRSAAATAAGALSEAAEHAAGVLADTAERLAVVGGEQAGEFGLTARTRLADASERMAKRIRPRRRRRRLRTLLLGVGVVGVGAGVGAGVWLSPLGARIRMLLGMTPAEEMGPPPPSIVLPSEPSAATATETGTPEAPAAANGDRVLTGGRRSSGRKAQEG